MNPEMKTKVDEILKGYGRRELNMDEAALVVGGAEPTILVNGSPRPRSEFDNVVMQVALEIGFDVAMNFIDSVAGCNRFANCTSSSSPDQIRKDVNEILDLFWVRVRDSRYIP